MSLRRRRSGLRSNKKRLMNTANEVLDSRNKLKAIPEEEDAPAHSKYRDMSSSEKPVVNSKLLNDTILEERESPLALKGYEDSSMQDDEDEDNPFRREAHLRKQREHRRGVMSKLSKKMARDFYENKKSFSGVSAGLSSNTQQLSEQRLKEEYLDKTVYKITKPRSPARAPLNSKDAHNLSIQFEDAMMENQEQSFEEKK